MAYICSGVTLSTIIERLTLSPPNIPLLQYSSMFVVKPSYADLAQKTMPYIFE